MMDQVTRRMHKFASAYLDDHIVFSSTWEDHLSHLRAVLSRLQELGLVIVLFQFPFAIIVPVLEP